MKKMSKKKFHELLMKMEWEGGLDGFISYGPDDYVKGTELEAPFQELVEAQNKVENMINELRVKYGEPEYD